MEAKLIYAYICLVLDISNFPSQLSYLLIRSENYFRLLPQRTERSSNDRAKKETPIDH
jgi:hypothetical protein